MIVLGVILLIVGLLAGIGILTLVGAALILLGAIFAVAGFAGRPVGGRHWY